MARTDDTSANAVDSHVGKRIRLRRQTLGLSQGKLAEALGLTFQQVQKYEKGANRVGASRLFDLANVLDVPVEYFFQDLQVAGPVPVSFGGIPVGPTVEPSLKRDTIELMQAYYSISDPRVRRRVYDLARALADSMG